MAVCVWEKWRERRTVWLCTNMWSLVSDIPTYRVFQTTKAHILFISRVSIFWDILFILRVRANLLQVVHYFISGLKVTATFKITCAIARKKQWNARAEPSFPKCNSIHSTKFEIEYMMGRLRICITKNITKIY